LARRSWLVASTHDWQNAWYSIRWSYAGKLCRCGPPYWLALTYFHSLCPPCAACCRGDLERNTG
jgi:hypothetical protein